MKKNEIEVSIVVPVHNPPLSAFEHMLETVFSQTNSDYELIIVDDASEDYIKVFLEKIANRENIKIISLPNNLGVSHARNVGIEHASGQYVTFIDADDYVANTFLENALNKAKKYDADVVFGNIERTTDFESKYEKSDDEEQFFTVDTIDYVKASMLGYTTPECKNRVSGSPCGNLYRRSLCLASGFSENIKYFEDQLFNRKILLKAKMVVVCSDRWYFYLQNEESAMHKSSIDKNVLDNIVGLLDEFNDINEKESEFINNRYKHYLIHLYLGILTLVYKKTQHNIVETSEVMSNVRNRQEYIGLLETRISDVTAKEKIMLALIKYANSKQIIKLLKMSGKLYN